MEDKPPEVPPPALLLRIEEAAQRLGIARTLMYELIRRGEVQSVHVGRLHRIPVECLDEFVQDLLSRAKSA